MMAQAKVDGSDADAVNVRRFDQLCIGNCSRYGRSHLLSHRARLGRELASVDYQGGMEDGTYLVWEREDASFARGA